MSADAGLRGAPGAGAPATRAGGRPARRPPRSRASSRRPGASAAPLSLPPHVTATGPVAGRRPRARPLHRRVHAGQRRTRSWRLRDARLQHLVGGGAARRLVAARRPARRRRRRRHRLRGRAAHAPVAALGDPPSASLFAAITAWNGVDFYLAWRAGDLGPRVPFPLSFVIAPCSSSSRGPRSGRRRRGAGGSPRPPSSSSPRPPASSSSRSRRSSSSARPTTGGRPTWSSSSAPRSTRTARRRRRWRPHDDGDRSLQGPPRQEVLVSGGVGDSGFNEAIVMRDMAVEAGVAEPRRDRGLERA